MNVLSVKQPHAFLLAIGVKPIENRTWKLPEKYKGERILIHASGKPAKIETEIPGQATAHEIKLLTSLNFCDENDLYSAIIGSVRFVDCVINHESIWAEKSIETIVDQTTGLTAYLCNGEYREKPIQNWLAADPILFDKPILNVKGKLGFWEYSHPMCCPICAYPLHLQKTGDIITDAFCFNCKKDIELC